MLTFQKTTQGHNPEDDNWYNRRAVTNSSAFSRNFRRAHQASYPVVTWGTFPRDKSGRAVKLTTHLHLVLRLKMCSAMPHFPHITFLDAFVRKWYNVPVSFTMSVCLSCLFTACNNSRIADWIFIKFYIEKLHKKLSVVFIKIRQKQRWWQHSTWGPTCISVCRSDFLNPACARKWGNSLWSHHLGNTLLTQTSLAPDDVTATICKGQSLCLHRVNSLP